MRIAFLGSRGLLLVLVSSLGAFVACGGDDGTPSAVTDAGPGSPSTDSSTPLVPGPDAATLPDSGVLPDGAAPVVATITGTIQHEYFPVAGAFAVIQGKVASTAADGTFHLERIQVPYDLSIVLPIALFGQAATSSFVQHYAGLTTPAPVIEVARSVKQDGAHATMTGSLAGLAPSTDAKFLVRSYAPLARGNQSVGSVPPDDDAYVATTYSNTLAWPNDQTARNAGLVALELVATTASTIPTAYKSISRTTFPVAAGGSYTDQLSPMQAVGTAHVSGTVEIPSGFSIAGWTLALGNEDGLLYDFLQNAPNAPPTFDFPVADSEWLPTISVGVRLTGPQGAILLTQTAPKGATNIVLAPKPPPSLELPADAAQGIAPGVTLSWVRRKTTASTSSHSAPK